MVPGDSVLRAMTDDGTFRVVTAETTRTVSGALAAQGPKGDTARHLGDLLTGVILTRLTMAPQLRVQAILRGSDGKSSLVADSHPSGDTRALVGPTEFELGPGSLLRLMRTLHDGRLHQGIVSVPGGNISDALMVYMQESEQVTTMVAVGTRLDGGEVVRAGGYLVQLLPGAQRGPLMVMTERLRDFSTMEPWLSQPEFSPAHLMGELLHAMPHTALGESSVQFGCWCSQVSVVSALSTLPRAEVQSMIDEGETLEIQCDYCRADYRVQPAELRGLTEPS